VALAAGLLLALPAMAGADGGVTAPSYPGNTIQVDAEGPLVAGTAQTVKLSGHAEWGEPTSPTSTLFGVAMYAQDPRVDPACAPSFGGQLQKVINLPGLNASASPTGFVVGDGAIRISPTPPATGQDWSITSPPFVVRRGLEQVLLCAYQRYVTDDVAAFQRTVRVDQPGCSFRPSSVRRGRVARLRCNFTGEVTARLTRRGQRGRTARATVGASGTATLRVGRLAKGRWTARFVSNDVAVGRATLRVR
jgi:hypothetical protein